MEILEAFDLAGALRGAAELAGCDHKTVGHWVRAREDAGGGLPVAARRQPIDEVFAGKIEELVDGSHGRIRADRVSPASNSWSSTPTARRGRARSPATS